MLLIGVMYFDVETWLHLGQSTVWPRRRRVVGETGLQYHGQIDMTHAKTTGASDKALVHLSPACSYAIYRTVVGPFEMPHRGGPGSIV